MFKNFTRFLKFKYQIPNLIGFGLYSAYNINSFCYGGYDAVDCYKNTSICKGMISGKEFNRLITSDATLPNHRTQLIFLDDNMVTENNIKCVMGLNTTSESLDVSVCDAKYANGPGYYITNSASSYRHGYHGTRMFVVTIPGDACLLCSHIGCLTTSIVIDHEVTSLTELSSLGYRNLAGDIYDFIPHEQMINSATHSDLIIGLTDRNIRLSDIPKEKLTKEILQSVCQRINKDR
jgi:hypothetical protein